MRKALEEMTAAMAGAGLGQTKEKDDAGAAIRVEKRMSVRVCVCEE